MVSFLAMAIVMLCTAILSGAQRLSTAAKQGFYQSVSGTDLLVGARTSNINLLLYSVFHIGNASNNVSWESLQDIRGWPDVKWTIPLSLGDSYRGYRVVGTTKDFFDYFQYGNKRKIALAKGKQFSQATQVVIGHEVATKSKHKLGDTIYLTHGTGEADVGVHKHLTFEIVGVMQQTNTAIDRAVMVDLIGLELVHMPAERTQKLLNDPSALADIEPKSVTAFLAGLNSRIAAFALQRKINEYPDEALSAALPTVTLAALWQLISGAEKSVAALGVAMVCLGLLALVAVSLASLRERSREFAVLRANGLSRLQLIGMVQIEIIAVSMFACLIGLAASYLLLQLLAPWISSVSGIDLQTQGFGAFDLVVMAIVLIGSAVVGMIPAYTAYRGQLNQGLTPKL